MKSEQVRTSPSTASQGSPLKWGLAVPPRANASRSLGKSLLRPGQICSHSFHIQRWGQLLLTVSLYHAFTAFNKGYKCPPRPPSYRKECHMLQLDHHSLWSQDELCSQTSFFAWDQGLKQSKISWILHNSLGSWNLLNSLGATWICQSSTPTPCLLDAYRGNSASPARSKSKAWDDPKKTSLPTPANFQVQVSSFNDS